MGLRNLVEEVNDWREKKLNGLVYEANKLEIAIVEKAKIEIQEDLAIFSQAEIHNAVKDIKDLFTAYCDIRNDGKHLAETKVLLLSDIKRLKIKAERWGLEETEERSLATKENNLRVIDLQLQIYNHLVNFNIPDSIALYCEVGRERQLEILLEIYKFIDEDGFNNLCKERENLVNE